MSSPTIPVARLTGPRTDAEYLAADSAWLLMTLRQLRLVAVLIPLAGVIVLEIVRYALIGSVSLQKRLILDAVLALAVVLFTAFMFRAITAMQNRLERHNRELLALHAAGLDIAAELSLDAVLTKVVDQARALVGAKYGALSVIDADNRIETFVTSGISRDQREAIGPPPVGHGLLGVVLHHGEPLRLRDLTGDPRSQGFPPHHPSMRSLLAVPVPTKEGFKGNLYLAEKERVAEFTTEDEETLQRFALQAAIAIDNAQLHGKVADLAIAQERLRISHEMHDGLAQVLGYVNTKVQAANEYLRQGKGDEASSQLRELAVSARQAYTDVRESIVALRTLPTREHSLADALSEYLARWKEQSGVSTHLTIDGNLRLRPRIELQLVRIVQEALANVRKHARAESAHVYVRRVNEKLTVSVVDDGLGFDPAAKTRREFPQFGLTTMRERAESIGATLRVESLPGRGTTVQMEMPIEAALAD